MVSTDVRFRGVSLRRFAAFGAVCVAAVALAACGSSDVGAKKLKPIHAGMPRDSVLTIMGSGPLMGYYSDTLRLVKGFRASKYLVQGKMTEVLYYREEKGNVAEPVEQVLETPIVLQDEKALGWGWKYYVKAMGQIGLPSPIQAKKDTATAKS